ncbi:hypothetical protein K432DRAFT_421704 [Lepidopterella palustris CBS 459.81]|uniref:Uncharacterized protein n=1 Tax=Lepidopterella palustris CBS 459.81 TaxID=1314670 RepID=A0A8E2JKQ0_9PEZI|nr:hypothetical protein K432DRAFT_421704 [Lepidopterella palustris CBS 459.81]
MPGPLVDISPNPRRVNIQSSKLSSRRNSKLSPYSQLSGRNSPARATPSPSRSSPHYMEATTSSMKTQTPNAASKLPRRAATPNSLSKDTAKGLINAAAQHIGTGRANASSRSPNGNPANGGRVVTPRACNTTGMAAGRVTTPVSSNKPLPSPPIACVSTNASPTKLTRTLLDASDKPLKMAAGTPHEQEWPALYPEQASTPDTLEFASRHPIQQLASPTSASGSLGLHAENSSSAWKVRSHDSANVPTIRHVRDAFPGNENKVGAGTQSFSTVGLHAEVTVRNPQLLSVEPDMSPAAAAIQKLSDSSSLAVPTPPSRASSLRDRISNGSIINDGPAAKKVTGFTDFTTKSPAKQSRNNLIQSKMPHSEPPSTSVIEDNSNMNEIGHGNTPGVEILTVNSGSSGTATEVNAADTALEDPQALPGSPHKRSSIPVPASSPSPVRAQSSASRSNVSSTGATKWPLLNTKSSSESEGYSTIHDYGPNLDDISDHQAIMRDGPKRLSDAYGNAPNTQPQTVSEATANGSRSSTASPHENASSHRASMESRASGIRVKRLSAHSHQSGLGPVLTIHEEADTVLLGNTQKAPDVPSIDTDLYRTAVHNNSHQAMRREAQPEKPAVYRPTGLRARTPQLQVPNGRKQPGRSPPAIKPPTSRQTSFETQSRRATHEIAKIQKDAGSRQVSSAQGLGQRRHPANSNEKSPVDSRAVNFEKHPTRYSSLASNRTAKVSIPFPTSIYKESLLDIHSASKSSPEETESPRIHPSTKLEARKATVVPAASQTASDPIQNRSRTPSEESKDSALAQAQSHTPGLFPPTRLEGSASKDSSSIGYPTRVEPQPAHSQDLSYQSHRSTFIPGVCASPGHLPERITNPRLSHDFKTSHYKGASSLGTFSSKTFTDSGQTSKIKFAKSIRNLFHKRDSRSTVKSSLAEVAEGTTENGSPVATNGISFADLERMKVSRVRAQPPTPSPASLSLLAKQVSSGLTDTHSSNAGSPSSIRSSATASIVRDVREAANSLPFDSVERFRLLNVAEIMVSTIQHAKQAAKHALVAKANAQEAEHESKLAQLAAQQLRSMMTKNMSHGDKFGDLFRRVEAPITSRHGSKSSRNGH